MAMLLLLLLLLWLQRPGLPRILLESLELLRLPCAATAIANFCCHHYNPLQLSLLLLLLIFGVVS